MVTGLYNVKEKRWIMLEDDQCLWCEVTQTATAFENKMKCEGLKPLHKYRFRVKAVNKYEISDPGEMTGDDILMKDPWGKLIKFNYSNIYCNRAF